MLYWTQLVPILREAVISKIEKNPRLVNKRSLTDAISIEFPYSIIDRANSLN